MSAAARVRASGEDFSSSFLELRQVVTEACDAHREWPLQVIAGIHASVAFAAASPAKAEALTLKARRPNASGRLSDREVIDYFADLLGAVASAEQRFSISTDVAIVEAIATVVRGHLIAGTPELLPDAVPDLVYLALMPYLGLAETRRWIEAAVS